MTNDTHKAAGRGLCTSILALDISAAIDAVYHDKLLDHALTVFDIDDVALDGIRSFVTERTQQIVVGSDKSTVFSSKSGVPQGSVLGPILFGKYVSPFGDVIAQHRVHYYQYAYDMPLYVSLRPHDCVTIPSLNQCATDVSRWSTENVLLLNHTKTEAVIFEISKRIRQVPSTPGVLVAGANAKFSDAVKLLGVTLDSALTFDKHIMNVTRCCHYHTRALRHIRPLLTLDTANTIATSCCTVCRRRILIGYSVRRMF